MFFLLPPLPHNLNVHFSLRAIAREEERNRIEEEHLALLALANAPPAMAPENPPSDDEVEFLGMRWADEESIVIIEPEDNGLHGDDLRAFVYEDEREEGGRDEDNVEPWDAMGDSNDGYSDPEQPEENLHVEQSDPEAPDEEEEQSDPEAPDEDEQQSDPEEHEDDRHEEQEIETDRDSDAEPLVSELSEDSSGSDPPAVVSRRRNVPASWG